MGIYSIFLDKDMYFDKGCSINGRSFNHLAEFVKVYLSSNDKINRIYIAGACYCRNSTSADELVEACFGNKRKYKIATISRYRGFNYKFVDDAIKKFQIFLNTLVKKKYDHRKMMYFLIDDEVVAILIGSSNFSRNTYMYDIASEADILLVKEGMGNEKFISGLIESNQKELLISKTLKNNNDKYLQKIFEENLSQLTEIK
ncbi:MULTISPECIES: hypothetical protein [unclassified Faecalibacillus]|jgi:phosphatidylserine/phosphatidylglycerophosphate/cardiolipin synthase-like enzyme|uniref:hypothetical protein n=1 Tax=unclassified Faecalibacillus TaxID=2678890 RepID=UPI001D0BBABD|nr:MULTISPECIES: hypothetical protein [unclassified Faecalibacillus]MCB8541089.1 hypothetical protein [Faecalibacillus sp. TM498]MCB8558762.1 hypothetical protein [Faecalibacillus sp. TM111]